MESTISDLPTYQTVPLSDLMRPRFVGGRVSLPIASSSPFAHFEHIDGVPSRDGSGFSFSRLQVLDVLIDRLIKLKDQEIAANVPQDRTGLSVESQDALINDLAHRLQVASQAKPVGLAEHIGESFGMMTSDNGAMLNVTV